tara:strand:- start:14162 stop:14800 length:639 start_codon:yes stop_codon:yes gene_type:complete
MKYIGLSGVAGAGKDLFFSMLSEKIQCQRLSLADELKEDVKDWCLYNYGIDPTSCSREDKDVLRPFLVFHGMQKRNKSDGRYWIDRLQLKIKALEQKVKNSPFEDMYGVITDIRYDDYEWDEVGFLKNELNGCLVHILQYEEESDSNEGCLYRHPRQPANDEEARNDPKLKKKADFNIEWKFLENGQIDKLTPHVDDFVEWLKSKDENETPK